MDVLIVKQILSTFTKVRKPWSAEKFDKNFTAQARIFYQKLYANSWIRIKLARVNIYNEDFYMKPKQMSNPRDIQK